MARWLLVRVEALALLWIVAVLVGCNPRYPQRMTVTPQHPSSGYVAPQQSDCVLKFDPTSLPKSTKLRGGTQVEGLSPSIGLTLKNSLDSSGVCRKATEVANATFNLDANYSSFKLSRPNSLGRNIMYFTGNGVLIVGSVVGIIGTSTGRNDVSLAGAIVALAGGAVALSSLLLPRHSKVDLTMAGTLTNNAGSRIWSDKVTVSRQAHGSISDTQYARLVEEAISDASSQLASGAAPALHAAARTVPPQVVSPPGPVAQPGSPPSGQGTVMQRMKELQKLYDAGLINKKEFMKKKKELMDSL